MVDSLLIHIWQRPWTRILSLVFLLGPWIAVLAAGLAGIIGAK
jgi:hypothetical protein